MARVTRKDYPEEGSQTPLDFLITLAANHTGNDPTNLPTLSDYINGDLINKFLRNPPAAGTLRFKWQSMVVLLTADKQVIIKSFDGNSPGQKQNPDIGLPRAIANSSNSHAARRNGK